MEIQPPVDESPKGPFQYIVTVLILFTTILGACVALLQAHASVHEDQAARDKIALAIQVMGELQRSGQETTYELGVLADHTVLSMEVIALQATALELEQDGRSAEADTYQQRAEIVQAQADALRPLSLLLTDPRYAPQGDEVSPDIASYVADVQGPVQDLLARQQEAAELTDQWGAKADAYTSIITILAIATFLFGLSLVIQGRARYLFVGAGVLVVLLALLWTILVLAGG